MSQNSDLYEAGESRQAAALRALDAGPAPQGGSRADSALLPFRKDVPPEQYDIPALIAQNADALQALSLQIEGIHGNMAKALVTFTNLRDALHALMLAEGEAAL